jgi:3-oxoacyl-[acyl-carrier-protein] synthase II
MRRVVVTGMGAISPVGLDVEANWASLLSARSGIRRITQFDATGYSSQIAGEVDFAPEKFLPVKDLKKMDRFIQLALVAGDEAMRSSGLDLSKTDLERFGANVGVGIGGLPEISATHRDLLEKGPRRISPFFIPAVISNLAAGQLSLKYGLKGPNLCVTSACSSSAHAIGEAMRTIQAGDVDLMLAGGAEAAICELGVGGFCAMRALSQRNDAPEAASRPFDRDRDGFVIGEGAAVLVLEELEHAKRRGATIVAELVGYGANADAHHMTQPAPEGEGAARCMRLALRSGRVAPEAVGYINAHGTSTPQGDQQETQAIKSVFGDHAKKLAVSSTKSMTGHLLGAAGALEALYTCLAIRHQVAPPTRNLDHPSPECDLNYVPHEPQQRPIRYALSNSFGFGGTNASLLLGAFEG